MEKHPDKESVLRYIKALGKSVKALENYAEIDATWNEHLYEAIKEIRARLDRLEVATIVLAITLLILSIKSFI